MDPQVIKYILETVRKEQEYLSPIDIEQRKKGHMRSIRLQIAEEGLAGKQETYSKQLDEIIKKHYGAFGIGFDKTVKEIKYIQDSLTPLITEYFARFAAEQYQDYADVKAAQYIEYKRRYQMYEETAIAGIPEAVYDTYIPKGFLEDKELSDKRHINTIYFNPTEHIVVWVLKGVDFGEAFREDRRDIYTIVADEFTNWAIKDYYSYMYKVIEKYKLDPNFMRQNWKLYLTSHSRGAAMQLALMTIDWYSTKSVQLNEKGINLFNAGEYPVQDLSKYVDGAFLFTPGFPPWGVKGFMKEKQDLKKDKIQHLNKIMYLGFVKGEGILATGKGAGLLSRDPISEGADFNNFPYGKKFYSKQRAWSPHTIFNFLSDYVVNLEPILKPPKVEEIQPFRKLTEEEVGKVLGPKFFPITEEEEQEIFNVVTQDVEERIRVGKLDPKEKDNEIDRIVSEIEGGIIEREKERITYENELNIMIEEQPNLIYKTGTDVSGGFVEVKPIPTVIEIGQPNLIYSQNQKNLSELIDIDMSTSSAAYKRGVDHKNKGIQKTQKEMKMDDTEYANYKAGLESGKRGENIKTKKELKHESVLKAMEEHEQMLLDQAEAHESYRSRAKASKEPKFTAEKGKARSGGGAGATQRTQPASKFHGESYQSKATSNPHITIENQVAEMFGGAEIPQFHPRVKQEPKATEFVVDKDGTLKKTYTVGKDLPSSIVQKPKRVDKHKGNKIEVPILPEPTKEKKTVKSKAMKEKEVKNKAPTIKKLTKSQKIYSL